MTREHTCTLHFAHSNQRLRYCKDMGDDRWDQTKVHHLYKVGYIAVWQGVPFWRISDIMRSLC